MAALDSTTNSNESLKIQRLFFLHADFHGLVFSLFLETPLFTKLFYATKTKI